MEKYFGSLQYCLHFGLLMTLRFLIGFIKLESSQQSAQKRKRTIYQLQNPTALATAFNFSWLLLLQ